MTSHPSPSPGFRRGLLFETRSPGRKSGDTGSLGVPDCEWHARRHSHPESPGFRIHAKHDILSFSLGGPPPAGANPALRAWRNGWSTVASLTRSPGRKSGDTGLLGVPGCEWHARRHSHPESPGFRIHAKHDILSFSLGGPPPAGANPALRAWRNGWSTVASLTRSPGRKSGDTGLLSVPGCEWHARRHSHPESPGFRQGLLF
jgi:predicted small metal-binding protein